MSDNSFLFSIYIFNLLVENKNGFTWQFWSKNTLNTEYIEVYALSEKWKVSIDLVNVLENVTFIMLSSISFLSLDIIKARTILAFLWALFRKT